MTIAALYVQTGGVYYGMPDVDPWDEKRDARLYAGPWPVVAHPPCSRWCRLAPVIQKRWGHRIGSDNGCFAAALRSVDEFGGVLEHPASSYAWAAFRLMPPERGRWSFDLIRRAWVAEVCQSAYGHRARKATWLYYVGSAPPPEMDWRDLPGTHWCGNADQTCGKDYAGRKPTLGKAEASRTPTAFRDVLLNIAKGAKA